VLVNLIAAGLFLGLVAMLHLRPPPRRLRGPLLAFDLFVLLYIVGDAITLTSPDLFWEQLGIAILYTGSIPAAALCFRVALRYGEEQGHPFRLGARLWPLAAFAAFASWLVVLTNPWHGKVLVPVIGAHNVHLALYGPVVGVGYALTVAASALFARLARRVADSKVRHSAWAMAVGPLSTMILNLMAYHTPAIVPWDLTVLGLSLTSILLLAGAYRTRLFNLLPVAYSEILRHDPDGILLAGPEGTLLQSNPAAGKLLGEAPPGSGAELFGWLSARLIDSDGRELAPGVLRQRLEAIEDPEALGFAVRGEPDRWLRASLTPIPPPPSPREAICVRLVDVSRERRATLALQGAHDQLEIRVAERTEALRASEERYRMVSELSSDASFALEVGEGGALRPRWHTAAMEQVTGWGPKELDAAGWMSPIHPDDRERLLGEISPMIAGARHRVEFRIHTPHGAVKWLALDVSRVASRDGSSLVVGSVRDVSERYQAEAESQALAARVQEVQRLEGLGVLAGGIAHDFNNLLAVVLGNGTLALQEAPQGSPLHRRLERIRAASEHAALLTQQMLTYAGRAEPKRIALDLSAVLDQMIDLVRASAGSGCVVRTELANGLPPISGDETQLRQVLLNLVTNAAEASSGRGELRIATRLERVESGLLARTMGAAQLEPGEYVTLVVSDRGCGMDEATRRRVFDPFFSTKFAGRGLGLAVVLGIVRAHGGAIALESRPGVGTTFRILFPIALGEATPSARPRAPSPPGGDGATVLVVDDDDAVLEYACDSLSQGGYRVHTASGGRAALAWLEGRAAEIDAAVVDLTMPEVDGREVLAAIRQLRGELPVVVTSGFDAQVARERLGDLGGAAFLRKPFLPDQLLSALGGVLAARGAS
jgi:PAS domain S-box-containing protein